MPFEVAKTAVVVEYPWFALASTAVVVVLIAIGITLGLWYAWRFINGRSNH